MPYRPQMPCKHPGCGMLVEYGQKYCIEHKPLHPEYTRAASKRGYSSAWQKASKAYLREHPLCVECLKLGRYTQAKAALLIDADNTQISRLDDIMRIASSYGRVVLKRAYGNWQKDSLKNWKEYLKRLAIKAEQQFDYVSGKNATDIALVIDAMSLLQTNLYDIFVISASDSDYTPLAVKLRESGVGVIGIGEKTAPKAFKNSCDEYICIEELGNKGASPLQQGRADTSDSDANAVSDPVGETLKLLKTAAEKYKDENGFVYIGTASMYIRRASPGFDVKALGYPKLTKLIEAYPEMFEIKEYIGGEDNRVVGYKYRVKVQEK